MLGASTGGWIASTKSVSLVLCLCPHLHHPQCLTPLVQGPDDVTTDPVVQLTATQHINARSTSTRAGKNLTSVASTGKHVLTCLQQACHHRPNFVLQCEAELCHGLVAAKPPTTLPGFAPPFLAHLRASSSPATLASPPTVCWWPWLMVARVGSARPPSTASHTRGRGARRMGSMRCRNSGSGGVEVWWWWWCVGGGKGGVDRWRQGQVAERWSDSHCDPGC